MKHGLTFLAFPVGKEEIFSTWNIGSVSFMS